MNNRPLFFGIALLLTLPLLFGVSFTSNPEFNEGNLVFTNDELSCAWTFTDATTQNITVFRDGILFTARNESGTLNTSINISSGNTTKNEVWECRVQLNNATDSTIRPINVTIQNSAPETPIIYNSTNDDIGTSYTITEDAEYVFDVNSSDIDDDELTYLFIPGDDEFCLIDDSATGAVTCSPTQADLIGGNSTEVNVTFSVRDDDAFFKKTAATTVTFTVIPVNDAPNTTLEDQETPVNQTLIYDINATDEENNTPLSFTLVNTPADLTGAVSIDANTGVFVFNASQATPTAVNESGWLVTVNISDSLNASALFNFTLNVTAVGRAPEIIAVSPDNTTFFLLQGANILINVTANDSDSNETHVFRNESTQAFFQTTTLQPFNNVTGNTTAQINFTATNDDVGTFPVNITVEDSELLTDTITLNFTVINTNDPPVLNELSTDSENTNSNTNLSNLTSFAGAPLYFQVNATDIDIQYGDALNYSDNATFFNINPLTGEINFTPQITDVQTTPYRINITVTDNESLQDSRIIDFYILNNTAPFFNTTPPNQTCFEGAECTYNVALYAEDPDGDDSIVNYQVDGNLTSLQVNETTGLINFTPTQTEIGMYPLAITITDSRGATNTTNITLTVNNTEEAPDLVRFDFNGETIVETFLFTYQLQAQDNDLLANVSENLTFTTNVSFIGIDTYTTGGNQTNAILSFTPNSSQVGNYTINITVTDAANLTDTEIFTFEILPDTEPPSIQRIQPYPNASNSSYPVQDWNSTSQGTSNLLAFPENSTFTFAHETTDDVTNDDPLTGNLTTTWFYNGENVSSDWNYTATFDFFSSGLQQLTLQVNDTTLESTNYTWNLNIENINRAPLLINPLDNFTNLTQPDTITQYFTRGAAGNSTITRFIDPDDDLNSNLLYDGGDRSSLTFAATECLSGTTTIATLTIVGDNLTIVPRNQGNCSVIVTATDEDSATLQYNSVFINVTEQPEGEQETQASTSSAGGGGSTSRTSFIPLTREVELPEAINIIAPRMVTIYDNNSVIIPFEVENNWDERLDFIQLYARSNSTDITAEVNNNFIESLEVNQTRELFLEVENYRLGENYEVEVFANVSSPTFQDSAVVVLTSIEQASDGDEVDVKVTFARDLFNENPECQELNELLDRANEELDAQNFEEARRFVDTAINGCKYLVSTLQQPSDERPDALPSLITLREATLTTILFTALAFLIISTIAFIIYYHYSSREEDDI